MSYKLLIILFIFCSSAAIAQDEAAPAAPVSPVQAALETAREQVRSGYQDDAVATLRQLFDGGFTAVAVLTGDEDLGPLSGFGPYDQLIADMNRAAYPCEHDPIFAEFDFWVGNWDVHVANGTLAGHNTIASEQRGCVLIENWSSAFGGTGTSINYVDKASGEWVQIWNDASGSQINIRGGLTDDGMLLEGTIHYVGNGTTAPFRGLWSPLPDGRVRQFFEQADADGNWSPWFEGFYSRADGAD